MGTANHFKKCFLDLVGNRAFFTQADNAVVHFANGRDFGGGSGQKHLFRDIEFIAGDVSFFHADPEMVTNLDHGVAGDPIQVGARQSGGM